MCYSGSVYCVCCNREYDNPGGPDYVQGCGCTSNKCDACLSHGCVFQVKPKVLEVCRPHGACT